MPLRVLSNEDVRDLVESRLSSGLVSMLHPLEIRLSRDLLMAEVEYEMQEHPLQPKASRAEQVADQQRRDFHAWLHGQPEEVVIALYPAAEDGIGPEGCEVTDEDIDEIFGR